MLIITTFPDVCANEEAGRESEIKRKPKSYNDTNRSIELTKQPHSNNKRVQTHRFHINYVNCFGKSLRKNEEHKHTIMMVVESGKRRIITAS